MAGMNTPTIRLLAPYDAAVYRALRLRAMQEYPDAFTSDYDEESNRTIAWAEQRLTPDARRPHDFFIGAFCDGVLSGVVGLQGRYRAKERHNATVVGMAVVTASQGQGLGRLLLQALLAQARTLPALVQLDLTVTEGNAAAQRLYEDLGFKVVGVFPRAICVNGAYHAKVHMVLSL
jgi:ribosomal protein S18 acetylase RimI-like enzyme